MSAGPSQDELEELLERYWKNGEGNWNKRPNSNRRLTVLNQILEKHPRNARTRNTNGLGRAINMYLNKPNNQRTLNNKLALAKALNDALWNENVNTNYPNNWYFNNAPNGYNRKKLIANIAKNNLHNNAKTALTAIRNRKRTGPPPGPNNNTGLTNRYAKIRAEYGLPAFVHRDPGPSRNTANRVLSNLRRKFNFGSNVTNRLRAQINNINQPIESLEEMIYSKINRDLGEAHAELLAIQGMIGTLNSATSENNLTEKYTPLKNRINAIPNRNNLMGTARGNKARNLKNIKSQVRAKLNAKRAEVVDRIKQRVEELERVRNPDYYAKILNNDTSFSNKKNKVVKYAKNWLNVNLGTLFSRPINATTRRQILALLHPDKTRNNISRVKREALTGYIAKHDILKIPENNINIPSPGPRPNLPIGPVPGPGPIVPVPRPSPRPNLPIGPVPRPTPLPLPGPGPRPNLPIGPVPRPTPLPLPGPGPRPNVPVPLPLPNIPRKITLNTFLKKHRLASKNAVKHILMNNSIKNKPHRILSSGKEGGGLGGFGAGYLKNLTNSEWNAIVANLNSVNMTTAQKQAFRNAARLRRVQGYKINRFSSKALRSIGAGLFKAGSVILFMRKYLNDNQKKMIYKFLELKFGSGAARIAQKLLNARGNPSQSEINKPPQEILTTLQNFARMTPEQQLALGDLITSANRGNRAAQNQVRSIRNLAKFQSSVAAGVLAGGAARVAAMRNAFAAASRQAVRTGASNTARAQMFNQAARQGMTFGQGVQAARRMTNTTRAAVNRARMMSG